MFQADACFQAALHQTRAWKKQAREHKKATKALKARLKDLRIKHMEQEELLRKTQAELVEAREDRETIIDKYMDSEAFQQLLVQHDDLLYRKYYNDGWNDALKEVNRRHPGLFNPKVDFPCPLDLIPATQPTSGGGQSPRFAADPRILSSTRSLLRGEPSEASDDKTSF